MCPYKLSIFEQTERSISELVRLRSKASQSYAVINDFYAYYSLEAPGDNGVRKALYDYFGDNEMRGGFEELKVLSPLTATGEKFDLLISPFSALSPLTADNEWIALLSGAAKYLRAGGRFVFDLEPLRRMERGWEGAVRVIGSTRDDDGVELVVSEVLTLGCDGALRVRLALERVGDGGVVTCKGYHNLLLGIIDFERMVQLANETGFAVEEHITSLGAHERAGFCELSIWILRKKKGAGGDEAVPGGADT